MNEKELARVLTEHGRMALARVLYANLEPGKSRDPDLFFAMYDASAYAPEDRIRDDSPFASFDPAGLESFYRQGAPWFAEPIRQTLEGFEWSLDDLPVRWRQFIANLLMTDEENQLQAIDALLAAAPEYEQFFEDLLHLCDSVRGARPFWITYRERRTVNGEDRFFWPDPANVNGLTDAEQPISAIERELGLTLKKGVIHHVIEGQD